MKGSERKTFRSDTPVDSVESTTEQDMRPVYVGERVTFESYGNSEQKLYVRSDRLATERRGLEHEFGKGTYWDRPSRRETGYNGDRWLAAAVVRGPRLAATERTRPRLRCPP